MKTYHVVVTHVGGTILASYGSALQTMAEDYARQTSGTYATTIQAADRPAIGRRISAYPQPRSPKS